MSHKIRTILFLLGFLIIPFLSLCQYSGQVIINATYADLNQKLKAEKETGNTKNIALARAELGYFCQKTGVYTEALDQFNKAIILLEKKGPDTLYVNLINRLGAIHMELKNYESAIIHFDKCIQEAKKIEAHTAVALAKSNLGACYEKEGDYDKALDYQKESLKLYLKLDDIDGVSLVNENIGSIYEDLEDFGLARSYFETALKYHTTPDKAQANILNNLGDVYRKTGEFERGLHFTQQSLHIAQQINDAEELASAHKDLSKTYHFIGNEDRAYQELLTFLEIDELNKARYRANQASALQVIYDTKEKEAKIKELLHEGEIDDAQKYVLVCALVALAVIGFVWFLFLRRKRKEGQKLASYEKRILEVELENKKTEEANLQKEVHLKNSALSRYSLHLAQKNKMLSDLSQTLRNSLVRSNVDLKRKLNTVIKEIDFNLSQEHEWDEFMAFFNEIHPEYIELLNTKALCSLSPAELRLSVLLRLNLSSKEIAAILRLTPDSVRVSRYRLRKKLPIGAKEELSTFLTGF
ncbi:tetratricopeptide repeat protein [Zobellia alginiliquefaciens]|uniref:tetratricopeptide repeat protein n=1 Tax=Zobellia alginiliquefaciens TaxID=3032586 RepID=UPI0023E427A5|nr:tetratricopeptide repeat protein [Zobellia alginiliquefaciens]